jgi:hypothetical protein
MMKYLTIFILVNFKIYASDVSSWIEGVRSGEESLRVINGAKVMFRRISHDKEISKDEQCNRAIKLVEEDLAREAGVEMRIPYTLDYLYYDSNLKDCAVSISVSQQIIGKIKDLKMLKEAHEKEKDEIYQKMAQEKNINQELVDKNKELQNFILKNQKLLEKHGSLNNQYSLVQSALVAERDRVMSLHLRGMSISQFKKVIGVHPHIIMASGDTCYWHFKTYSASVHGNYQACWQGSYRNAYLLGVCDTRANKCYSRDP